MVHVSGGAGDSEFYAQLLRAYFDSANDAIFVLCNELKFLSCNRRMEEWLGIAEDELTRHNGRRPITDLVGNRSSAAQLEGAARAVMEGEAQRFECLLTPARGEARWVEINMTRVEVEAGEMVIAVARDITERREQMANILYQSTHDSLTGLPNRTSLQENLAGIQDDTPAAVLVIDIPRFRDINEALGLEFADRVLVEIARGLGGISAQYRDTRLYRLAGDQFVIVSRGTAARCWQEIADSVQHWLRAPVQCQDVELTLGCKVGISLYPEQVARGKDLLRTAEAALNAAKRHATLAVETYQPGQIASGSERLILINEMRQAILDQRIDIFLQPILPLHGQGRVRVEALARWEHPQRGSISPQQFIDLAETSGQIVELTWLIIEQTLEATVPRLHAGEIETVSINLSPYCLLDGGFTRRFAGYIEQYRMEPEWLMLEITESVAMSDRMQAYSMLSLREMGVELSIDDFGTGHSSLSKLRQLPVSELKIDRSFVTGMLSDENDEAIVSATIQLAHSLGLDVVAEGIEDADVLDRLRALGCDFGQGFHLCRPLGVEDFQAWLRAGAGSTGEVA